MFILGYSGNWFRNEIRNMKGASVSLVSIFKSGQADSKKHLENLFATCYVESKKSG